MYVVLYKQWLCTLYFKFVIICIMFYMYYVLPWISWFTGMQHVSIHLEQSSHAMNVVWTICLLPLVVRILHWVVKVFLLEFEYFRRCASLVLWPPLFFHLHLLLGYGMKHRSLINCISCLNYSGSLAYIWLTISRVMLSCYQGRELVCNCINSWELVIYGQSYTYFGLDILCINYIICFY